MPQSTPKSGRDPASPATLFHPAVAAWFDRSFAAPTAAQAQAWPAIQARPARADRGADRLGQDAGGVPRGDRRAGARRALAAAAAGRDPGRLRLAAQGAVQRHPAQPGGAAGRHPRGAAARRACPTSTSAPGCAPATRRTASATAHAQAAAAHPRHHAGVALHPARLGVGPRDARDHAHRDRRRDPRAGAEQARRAPRAVARAAGRAVRRAGCCASASRRRRSRSRTVARFLVGAGPDGAPPPTARSSTPATAARATSRSRCPPRRSKR